jgi:circadian clock protein KaiB
MSVTTTQLQLRLYVAGDAPNSRQALANLRELLTEHALEAELEVVDLLAEPGRGFEDRIVVTPTLVKLSPPPQRVVLGHLGDRGVVCEALGLPHG